MVFIKEELSYPSLHPSDPNPEESEPDITKQDGEAESQVGKQTGDHGRERDSSCLWEPWAWSSRGETLNTV